MFFLDRTSFCFGFLFCEFICIFLAPACDKTLIRATEDELDGWIDGWMDGWMAGWLAGWMDGWMDGWMHACICLLYTSPSPRDRQKSRMPSSA